MDLTIRPMTPQERMYSYSQSAQIESQTGCIGHLRGDLDSSGDAFISTWTDHRGDLKSKEFKDEFDEVINTLRFDKQYGNALNDRRSLSVFCHSCPESSFGNEREYGFRADTPRYTYMLRLNPFKGEYNVYCYCFQRSWLDQHLEAAKRGIRFISPDYQERFRLDDGDKIRITMPDGNSIERVCRYVDDYHLEVGSNLYHICELAEMLELNHQSVIPIRSSLPEHCFTVLQADGSIVAIERGKKGYFPTSEGGNLDTSRKSADMLNRKLGVSKAQEAAMAAGSMFGWDTPAADPKNYDEEGKAIKPKRRDRGDAR